MLTESRLSDFAKGRARACLVSDDFKFALPGGVGIPRRNGRTLQYWQPVTDWQDNDALYDADTIIAQLLRGSPDGKSYHLGGMYIEFDNSGAAVNPTPTINRDENLSYFNTLNSGDPNRDYLRVPLISTQLTSSNSTNWPLGNQPEFSAQTAGTTGIHGNTFSDGANSRVYGAALVAFVDSGDSSQDLVFARFYFAAANQVVKVAGSQIGIDWKYTFT